jgi:hypothetical protein
MVANFREAEFSSNVPLWLADDDGARIRYTFALALDEKAEWMRMGILARFTVFGTDESLTAIGRDRQIIRGFVEPADVYARRNQRWLESHAKGGNPLELMERVADYLYPFAVRVRLVNARGNWYTRNPDGTNTWSLGLGNWNWDATPSAWSRFWVIIYPLETGVFADEGVWGDDSDEWGDAEGTWGTSMSPEQVSSIREIVRHGKPPWARCENIIVAFDDASFDPSAPEPDGTWGNWGKPLGGFQTEARLATARYIDGTLNTTIQTSSS